MSKLSDALAVRRTLIEGIATRIMDTEADEIPEQNNIGIMAEEIADFLIDNEWVTEEPS